jgi:hypothetical protein
MYLKLSAVLLTGPLLLAAGVSNLWQLRRRPMFAFGWVIGAAILALGSWQLFKIGFLEFGPSPGSTGYVARDILSSLAFAAASPWLAATGLGSLVGHIYWRLGLDVGVLWSSGGWLVAPLTAAVWWLGVRWLIIPLTPIVRRGVILITVGSIAMLALLFMRGAPIGLDDRYMRPTATLLLLVIAFNLQSPDSRLRTLARVMLAGIALFGAGCAVQRTIALIRNESRGREGIAQQHLSPTAIATFAELDSDGLPHTKLIYVPFPGIAFEIRRQRTLVTDDLGIEREHRWHGRVSELILAIPNIMEHDGRGARIRARFVDYRRDEWASEIRGDWYFWFARTPSS